MIKSNDPDAKCQRCGNTAMGEIWFVKIQTIINNCDNPWDQCAIPSKNYCKPCYKIKCHEKLTEYMADEYFN